MLSLTTLSDLFPEEGSFFKKPFIAEVEENEVYVYDAEYAMVMRFCTYTQLPISDNRAQKFEVDYMKREADKIAAALNASYPD